MYYYVFVGAFGLQRIPIIVLTFVVIFYSRDRKPKNLTNTAQREQIQVAEDDGEAIPNTDDGPSTRSRILLLVATIFNACGDLPLEVWADVLPKNCTLNVASLPDLVLFLYIFSLLFFFFFLRAEYIRKKEECMWQVVQKYQDTFAFKRF